MTFKHLTLPYPHILLFDSNSAYSVMYSWQDYLHWLLMDDVFKALYSIRIHGIIVTLFNNAILISSSRYVALKTGRFQFYASDKSFSTLDCLSESIFAALPSSLYSQMAHHFAHKVTCPIECCPTRNLVGEGLANHARLVAPSSNLIPSCLITSSLPLEH